MNEDLCRVYSDEEIGDALFQIGPLKAPGPDGLPACFFQRNWGLLKEDIIGAVKEFFNTGVMPPGVNDTCIVLIPKVNHPEHLKDFRPISLCNVIYKVASKVMANRLKVILPDIIAEEQSAFVPGRLIIDNIITAYECLHFMKKKRAQDQRCCALKLDMRKVYDRVEWDYLCAIMLRLGFHRLQVESIMRLVTTVSFPVLLNGARLENFVPSRGICQGDPISPLPVFVGSRGPFVPVKSQNTVIDS